MINALCISSGALIVALVLWLDIQSDYKDWKREKPINHSNQGFKRIMQLTPAVGLLTVPIYFQYPGFWVTILMTALAALLSFAMICFWYWLLFDGLYANKRRFNFWHLGSDGPEDGRLDNFLQSLTRAQHIAVKVGGCVLFTTIYILLLW